jgi:molecular chaperone DnaJ
MAAGTDYYEILGVSRNASKDELKSSYRKLALKYHPDRNKGDKKAEERFKEITHAYQILADDQKRQAYDQFGAEGVNASAGFGQGAGGFSDTFSDFFEDFFGGSSRRTSRGPAKGSDLGTEIEVKFEDAVSGIEKQINVKRTEQCRVCRGDGAKPGTSRKNCGTCHGTGQVSVTSGFFSIARTCAACQGAGSVITKPCVTCHGKGREEMTRKITVKIPPGVDNGMRLRVRGEGDSGYHGGTRGDLYVDIFVEPHPIFKRHDLDILCEVPISFVQAALGSEIEVPILNGSERIRIPAGTQTGKVFRLKGKGVPSLKLQTHGDQLVRTVVETPTALNSKQKDLLRDFDEMSGKKVNPISNSFFNKVKDFISNARNHSI